MKKTRKSRQAIAGSEQLSFLPELDFNPRWPSKNTLMDRALRMLLQGREITALDFEDETASQRLPAYIEKLFNEFGWPIRRRDVALSVRRAPKVRSFRRYFFDRKFIKKIEKIVGGAK